LVGVAGVGRADVEVDGLAELEVAGVGGGILITGVAGAVAGVLTGSEVVVMVDSEVGGLTETVEVTSASKSQTPPMTEAWAMTVVMEVAVAVTIWSERTVVENVSPVVEHCVKTAEAAASARMVSKASVRTSVEVSHSGGSHVLRASRMTKAKEDATACMGAAVSDITTAVWRIRYSNDIHVDARGCGRLSVL